MSYSTYEEYLNHPLFLESVTIAKKRSGGCCETIGCFNPCADPHHIRYCKWGEFDPPENLMMLCRQCHEKAHTCESCGKLYLKSYEIKRGLKTCKKCTKGGCH